MNSKITSSIYSAIPNQDHLEYGKLLHSDFSQTEAADRNYYLISAYAGLSGMLCLVLLPIIGAAISNNLAPLILSIIFSPFLALEIYRVKTQRVAIRSRVLLYERAIILVDNTTKEELKKYNIADIILIVIYSQANPLGVVLKTDGQRLIEWLSWRQIYNGEHFIEQLKALGIRVEVDIERNVLNKIIQSNKNIT